MARPILRTKLCDMLGIEYPIMSAGMGPSLVGEKPGAPLELVVAVSEAGGLGVLGGAGHTVESMREDIREIKRLTDKPFGVDILLPKAQVEQGDTAAGEGQEIPLNAVLENLPQEHRDWLKKIREDYNLPTPDLTIPMGNTGSRPHASVQVCIEEGVPLFCAGLGNPEFMIKDAHAAGMKVLGITGNAKNAGRMAASGCDFIVAQGHEGGGHTGRVGSMALWPQAIDAAAPVPVLAAGGIGDGRGVAAALAMGCIGAWIGTRFLATKEGGILDSQQDLILGATDEDTRRTHWHTGKTSRTIYGEIHTLWEESGLDPLPFPMQALLSSAVIGSFHAGDKPEFLSPFAGQIAGAIKEVKPAAEVLMDLVEEAADILARKLPNEVQAEV